uniref:Hemerythrin n=1 Tax=Delaya leruthi TaxID=1963245 RepID=A0A1S6QCV8_9ANNE|nr:hemerythrin [Delaya leruthi]
MGFGIPEPFCWDESFKVFYEGLDEEHRGLFKGIFDCSKNPGDAGALSHLTNVVKAHFAHEEELMKGADFSEFNSHKQIHDDFTNKLSELSTPLSDETILFAKDWLVNHIKGIDFKYKGKL